MLSSITSETGTKRLAAAFCALLIHVASAQQSDVLRTEKLESGKSLNDGTTSPNATSIRPSIVVIGDGLTEASFHPDNNGFGSFLTSNYTRKVKQGLKFSSSWCRSEHAFMLGSTLHTA
jgi:phage-related tail fiber protein